MFIFLSYSFYFYLKTIFATVFFSNKIMKIEIFIYIYNNIEFYFSYLGAETLAAITVNKVVTTDIAIKRFIPTKRGCYQDKEFSFPNLVSML